MHICLGSFRLCVCVCAQFRDPASDISMHLQHESYRELMSARLPLTSTSPAFTSKIARATKATKTAMASNRGAQTDERRVTLVSARSFRHRWTGMRKYSCVHIECGRCRKYFRMCEAFAILLSCSDVFFVVTRNDRMLCFLSTIKRTQLSCYSPLISDPAFFQMNFYSRTRTVYQTFDNADADAFYRSVHCALLRNRPLFFTLDDDMKAPSAEEMHRHQVHT
jgi:hypothetical protein